MLDSLRKLGSSWLGKLMMAFLLVGLAGFGISGVITSIGSTTVARVGGEDISIRDFQRAYNAQLNAVAQQTGAMPTAEQAMAFGVPGAALSRLANNAALAEMAGKMGLGASDQQLGRMLREDPNFAGVLGQFDRANFQRALQANGFTEAEYLKSLKQSAQREQIVKAVFSDIGVPQTALDIVARYTDDKRVLRYFILDPNSVLPPDPPTDDELAAYLKEHQGQYRTTAKRTATFLVLSPQVLAKSVKVSEDEIAAEYERTKANYVAAPTRDVRQAVLKDDAQKQMFSDGQSAGKSFDDLVAEAGLEVTDLGKVTKAGIADTSLADAAFALDEGKFALVPGVTGMRAVTVSNVNPGGQKSLDEVHDQIAASLKAKKSRDEYADVLDQIEELRAALKPLDEIAKRYNLTPTELTITNTGGELQAISDIPATGRTKVATAVFAANQGELTPGIPLGSSLNVWFELNKVEPARDQSVDDARDALVKAITDEKVQTSLEDSAKSAVAQIASGGDIDTIALGLNADLKTSDPITRSGQPNNAKSDITQAVAAAAFDGSDGHVGYAPGANGTFVVFKVDEIVAADAVPAAQIKTALQQSVQDNLLSEFVSAVRDDVGVQVSQGVLNQVIGAGTGN